MPASAMPLHHRPLHRHLRRLRDRARGPTGIATQAQSVVLRAVGVVAIGVLIMLSIPHLPLDVAHFKVVSIFAAISRA